jgi:hypothetical protein
VCAEHTGDVVGGGCLVCENAALREALLDARPFIADHLPIKGRIERLLITESPARDSSPRCHPAGTLELRDGKMTPVGGPGELQPGRVDPGCGLDCSCRWPTDEKQRRIEP